MNRTGLLLTMVLMSPLGLQAETSDDEIDKERKPAVRTLTLDQVPPAALKAARDEMPDVFFDSAERIIWRDDPVYQLNGARGRDVWRVYVSVQGNILRVERDTREGIGD